MQTNDEDHEDQLVERLRGLKLADLDPFDLNGYHTLCKILKIYDGDTFTIGFRFGTKFYKKSVRIEGIDTPELHSKVEKEAKLCRLGREFAKERYLDELVHVLMKENDKYGRILVELFDRETGESINRMMVQHKFARTYGGNLHKNEWTEEELDAGIAYAELLGIKDPGK